MRHVNLLTTAMICATVIITAGMLARAGDLNPPAGSIQPSMHTLDEVYDEVANLSNQAPAFPLCGGPWEAQNVFLDVSNPGPILIDSGSGILHAILTTKASSGDDRASVIINGELIAVTPNTADNAQPILLDVRYTNELSVARTVPGTGGSNINVTLLYRPDPQP